MYADLCFIGQGQRETQQDSDSLQTPCLTEESPVDSCTHTHPCVSILIGSLC